MKLAFATNNRKKSKELKNICEVYGFNVLDLNDLGINTEIEESGSTFYENAAMKARHLFGLTGVMSLGEDSGLEVKALDGKPGIYSARYAGQHGNDRENLSKLLADMLDIDDRSARFKTVIALCDGKKELFFEGVINGTIAKEALGNGGFGYDPVFIPDGFSIPFGEFTPEEKNKISHRARAVEKLAEYLKSTMHPR